MKRIKKGVILFEVLLAAILLVIMALGVMGVVGMEKAMLDRANRRLEAMRYAASAANRLLNILLYDPYVWGGTPNAYLTVGTHAEAEICTLPPTDFTNTRNATLYYNVTHHDISPEYPDDFYEFEVVVEWDEPAGTRESQLLRFGYKYW